MSAVITHLEPSQVRRRLLPFPANNARARELTVLTAIIAVAMFGFDRRIESLGGITTGTIAVLALCPVWIGILREFRFVSGLLVLAALTLLFGVALSRFQDGRPFSMMWAITIVVLFVNAMGGLGLLLWTRTVIPIWIIGVVFGLSRLIGQAPAIAGSRDAWKYQIAVPLAIALLAWASRAPGIRLTVLLLGLLGLVSIVLDYRSFFGFCLLAMVLVIWQNLRRKKQNKAGKFAMVTLIAALVVGFYALGSALLVEGYLGEDAQTRTVATIEQSGNVLVGGRPEWAGTIAVMQEHPSGFGIGTLMNSDDIWATKTGMASVGVDPHDKFRDDFMFGGLIKLHSTTADLWVAFGVMGLILAGTLIFLLVYSLLDRLQKRTATGMMCLISIVSIWSMLFNPISPNLYYVVFSLAVLLPTAKWIVKPAGSLAGEVATQRYFFSADTRPESAS